MNLIEFIPPDSRLTNRLKGVIRGPFPLLGTSINWIPIFCANCGKPHGYVPEENMDFVCWLCDGCAEKWGPELGGCLIPDEIFWRKAHFEQLDKYGRILSASELQSVVDSSCTPLSKLLRDRK
jgi:hypothetical protein